MATLAIFGSGCTPDPATKTAPKEMTAPKSSGGAMTPELRAAYIQAVQADASEEHRITRTEAGKLKATSPAQRLTATFATDGVTLDPTESDASHGSMALRGYGCEGDLEAGKLTKVSRAEPTFEGNRVEYRHAELVEWYLNGPLGLEQGFTIPAPPQCRNGKGALVLELELGGGLSAELRSGDPSDPGAAGATPTGAPASTSISAKGSELVLHHAEAPAVLRYTDLFARDAAGRQVPAWLTITKDRPAIHVNDAGAVYPLEIDPLIWHQQAKLLPAGGAAMDHFGVSVAIDQDTAIVGASNDDGSKGSAFVFVRSNGVWTQQQKLVPDNGAVSSGFGGSVSISQDTAIVGETQHVTASGNVGAAYVFVRSNGTWTKQQTLLASDGNADDSFGHAVSVSGDTAVVTASLDDDKAITAGAAYVFVRSNGTWTESQKLFANDAQANNYFGESVAVSGSTAIVGAFGSDSFKGSAYVFGKSGGTWTQQQKLVASDGAASDDFGRSIALSGNTAVVGAHGDDSDKGAAYVFVENGGTWTQQQKLVASDGVAGDFFGVSVAVSGDTAMVGARSEDNTNGADAGAAYIFLRNGSMWSQDVKLLASDGAANDQFGRSVAVSMTTAVVGAPFNNTAGADSGTAYVFLRASVGQACSVNADCETNFCVDGVCCNSACGGTNTTDCQACSVAAGATQDGLCGLRSAGALCRTSVGACDVAETCNGSSDTCPANVFAAAGTPCNDDNACTQTDACQAGRARSMP
jgi:hypothetical protein